MLEWITGKKVCGDQGKQEAISEGPVKDKPKKNSWGIESILQEKLTKLLLGVGVIAGNTWVNNKQESLLGSGKAESYIRRAWQR